MDIDEQLLSQNESEKAGEFRAATRGEMQEGGENEQASLRERVQQKRAQESKEKNQDDLASNLTPASGILKGTDEMLKFAWENLIDSFGLTLIWIDIHVFLNKVFGPKVFRDVGEEWLPDSVKKIAGSNKSAAGLLKIVEGSGIGCLNLGCLFLIIFIATLISIIASILNGDLSLIWALFKESLIALKNLFS